MELGGRQHGNGKFMVCGKMARCGLMRMLWGLPLLSLVPLEVPRKVPGLLFTFLASFPSPGSGLPGPSLYLQLGASGGTDGNVSRASLSSSLAASR